MRRPYIYYRLAGCKASREGAWQAVSQMGFLVKSEAHEEPVEQIVEYISGMKRLVKAIEQQDWDAIGRRNAEGAP